MKNLSELISQTLLIADDPNGEQFTEDLVKQVLNETMLDMALHAQLIFETFTVQLYENVYEYNLKDLAGREGTLRPFGLVVRVVYSEEESAALPPVSTAILGLSGTQINYISLPTNWRLDLLTPGLISIVPMPADGEELPALTGNLIVTYVAFPNAMDLDDDTPDRLDEMFHQSLSIGAASKLLESGMAREDIVLAEELDQEFYEWIMKVVQETYRGTTHYDSLRPL